MSNVHRKFVVEDDTGRQWGTISKIKIEGNRISGKLTPSVAYNEVRTLFKEHQRAFENPDADTVSTGSRISQLKTSLLETNSGKKYPIDLLFVSENLTITCDLFEPLAELEQF